MTSSNASLLGVHASLLGINASLLGVNSSLLEVNRSQLSVSELLPEVNASTCLAYQRSHEVTPLWDSALLHDCVCLHDDITPLEYRTWHCFETPPDLPFLTVAWVGYSILFVAGLTGNTLVCYVVFSATRMRTVTNILIANMAAGDLLIACLCMPFTFLHLVVFGFWPFGDALCRGVSFAQAVSVFVSAYTLVAISADRYTAIVHPLVSRGSRRRTRIVLLAVWMLALSTCVPIAVTSRADVPEAERHFAMHEHCVCQEVWEGNGRRYYTVVVMLLQYFLPVTVLAVTYGRIALEVWGRSSPFIRSQDVREIRLARAKRKTHKGF
ncbi:RYamide receptor-like [Pollicipes pollicipes]|uniref:RYamide receptor-like n=1 Tax=Pollicipes pollicipes TaxID=41117 RepID=UPI001885827C|nr:RYamide receptor-like [Pollicipes pollicipes]